MVATSTPKPKATFSPPPFEQRWNERVGQCSRVSLLRRSDHRLDDCFVFFLALSCGDCVVCVELSNFALNVGERKLLRFPPFDRHRSE